MPCSVNESDPDYNPSVTAISAIAEHGKFIVSLPFVVGIGASQHGGKRVIRVYATVGHDSIPGLPTHVEGFPIHVEVVDGAFVASVLNIIGHKAP